MSSMPRLRTTGRDATLDALMRAAHALNGSADDYDPLLELLGDAGLVLLGEASHGNPRVLPRARVDHPQADRGEGLHRSRSGSRWPDAYRVNRYVRGAPEDTDAEESLRGFRRFPTWMADRRGARFRRLAACAQRQPQPPNAVGFHGLDLYGLYTSIEEVIAYLQKIDPPAADRAGERYACFEHFGGESQEAEGRSAWKQRVLPARRGRAAAGALSQLGRLLRRDGLAAEDDQFYAEQNARLVADAEQHYRTMFAAHAPSWNLRDTHMADGRQSPGPPPTPRGAREARRLGAQLLCRRCASDTDGRVRRTQPRPAHPIATPGRRGARGVYDLLGERHHGLGVGRTGRAQAGPPGAARELRATLP